MHAKHIPMHIFRCRLIDFSQCLKLKAAFRQLRTFGELLILLNSSTYIEFYHRAIQKPTLKSHLRIDFYVTICQYCPTQPAHQFLSPGWPRHPTPGTTLSFYILIMVHSFSPAVLNIILTIIMKKQLVHKYLRVKHWWLSPRHYLIIVSQPLWDRYND